MKKVLVLVDKIGPSKNELFEYIAFNLAPEVEVSLGQFSDIVIEIDKGRVRVSVGELDLEDFSLVYFRKTGRRYVQLAATLAYFLDTRRIKYIDKSFGNIGASGNKLNSLVKFAQNNLPVIPSFYVSSSRVVSYSEVVIKKFGFPMFAKNLKMQRREGIFLLNNKADFKKLLKKDDSPGFLIQKQISIKKEFRVVVMGGKVVALHEESPRAFKNNRIVYDTTESVGGWLNTSNTLKKMSEAAIRSTALLNLNISGVDACIEEVSNNVYLIEVNRGPGFTLDPSISPELPELVKYLKRQL